MKSFTLRVRALARLALALLMLGGPGPGPASLTANIGQTTAPIVTRAVGAVAGVAAASALADVVGERTSGNAAATGTAPKGTAAPGTASPKAPILFVQNVGQFDSHALFQARTSRGTLWVSEDSLWVTVATAPMTTTRHLALPTAAKSQTKPVSGPVQGVNLKLTFLGANQHPLVQPFDPIITHVSYIHGRDPRTWHTNVPVWGGIRIVDLYPGIDLELSGSNGQWQPRLVARGGADPRIARLHIEGGTSIQIAGDQVAVTTKVGTLVLPSFGPAAIDSATQSTKATAVDQLTQQLTALFAPGTAEATPAINNAADLLYSTLLSGSVGSGPNGAVVDANDSVYLTGATSDTDFPTTPGAFQTTSGGGMYGTGFIAKLNPTGSGLVYSTYIGGSAEDAGIAIALDATGAAYVGGLTTSTDFPTTSGSFGASSCAASGCGFVVKLSPDGSTLDYGAVYGGSTYAETDGIAVDSSGAAYVTGYTQSSDFPTTSGAYSGTFNGYDAAFVAKINPSGSSLTYSMYLSGSSDDFGASIAVDTSGAAYVVGTVEGSGFPTTSGAFQTTFGGVWDGFVTKLNASGSGLVYSTFLGGSSFDDAFNVAVDGSGDAYVAGRTDSSDFPTTAGALQTTREGSEDGFVTKLNASGNGLVYSTYFGGSDVDDVEALAIDGTGNAYVVGQTFSSDLPTTTGAFDVSYNGCSDAFAAILNPSGNTLLYGSYLGGDTSAYLGSCGFTASAGVAPDGTGGIYVIGDTSASDFPTTPGAFQTAFTTNADAAFAVKLHHASLELDPVLAPLKMIGLDFRSTGADPVDTGSGTYTYRKVDLALAGRGPTPTFVRAYNSSDSVVGPLGVGWTESYNTRIAQDSAGHIVVVNSDGRRDVYTALGGGVFTPPPGVADVLSQDPASANYTLTHPDQSSASFNSSGQLTSFQDRYGNESAMTYNGSGELTGISDPAGRGTLVLTYDSCFTGRLCSVSDWLSPARSVLLGYDGSGRLTSVTDRTGQVTHYAYNTSNELTTITDANGHVAISMTYDSLGRVITQEDALGYTTGQQTTLSYVTNGDGSQTTTLTYPPASFDSTHPVVADTYNTSGQRTSRVTTVSATETYTETYTYDANYFLASTTDPLGQTTQYAYDVDYTGAAIPGSRGNLTRRIDPVPSGATNAPVTLFKYDAKNNLVETIPPLGVSAGTSVGPTTNLSAAINYAYATDSNYDVNGITLQSVTQHVTDPTLGFETAISQFEYGDATNPGRVTRAIPPRGNSGGSSLLGDQTVEASADSPAAGTAKAFSFLASSSGSVNQLMLYLDASSTATSVIVGLYSDSGASNPATLLAQGTLNTPRAGAWNPVAIPEVALVSGTRYWIAVLGPVGSGTPVFRDASSGSTSQLSSSSSLMTLPTAWSDGTSSTHGALSAYTVVPNDTYATTFAYGPPSSIQAGMLITTTDAVGDVFTDGYDAVGRRTSMVDPNGYVSGALTTDHQWFYTYDKEDRLLSTSAPAPTHGGTALTTQYQYDPVGNRAVVIDANGQVSAYHYDVRDSLAEVDQSPLTWTNPLVLPTTVYSTTYSYDNLGNLSQVTRAANDATNVRATQYTYDGLNRERSEIQYPQWPTMTTTLVTSYTYDQDSNLHTVLDPKGQTTTYGYDALNRLTALSYSDGGVTPSVSYAYDLNGNRTSMADGTGTTTYAYDELDRPITNTVPGPRSLTYRYDLDGNRTNLTYADGSVITSTYDTADRLQGLQDWAGRTMSYTYRPDGNLAATTNVNGTTATNNYDNARRLINVLNQTSSTVISQHSYTLDNVGNRSQIQETLASPGTQNPAAWGLNTSGQLGTTSGGTCGGLACSTTALPVAGSGGSGTLTGITQIAGGYGHSVALKTDGTVLTWGNNADGQLGDGTTTNRSSPVEVVGSGGSGYLTGIIAVTAGYSHTLALKSDGTVWAWGLNGNGELGNNTTTNSSTPVQVQGVGGTGTLGGVSAIAGGGTFSLALKSDGSTVWAWGAGGQGQLGNGTSTAAQKTPVTVSLPSGTTVTALAAGGAHGLALTSAGSVLAWGWNSSGQLGNGSTTGSTTPVSVSSLTGVASIAAGYQHSLAAKSDGTVWAWGDNCCGQLGQGTYGAGTGSTTPVQVHGQLGVGNLSGAANVVAGYAHSLAIDGSGTVWAWGYNADGQIGDGTTTGRINPVPLSSPSGITAVAAGAGHSLAVATTHQVTTNYTYDGLYRLTSGGTPGNPTTYTYDPVGNRLAQTVGPSSNSTSYAYDKADRVTSVGGVSYTVDANGNLTAYGSTALTYDQANRLTTAVIGSTTSHYTYDGDGKRATRTVGAGSPITYTYDINDSLPQVLDDGTRKYVYGLGLAYTVDDTITATVRVLHTDGLGSVRAITDGSGNVVETFATDEFGNPSLTQGASPEPLRFTGQQHDSESSFYNLRARYYSPSLGRFISRDPALGRNTEPLSLNHFVYAENNPVVLVDPSGLDPWGVYAHHIIEEDFVWHNPGWSEEVTHRANGAPVNNPLLGSIRVDLENQSTGDFYEIKPSSRQASGAPQINRYVKFGKDNNIPLQAAPNRYGQELLPSALPGLWLAAWGDPTVKGLILYQWFFPPTFGWFPSMDPADEVPNQIPAYQVGNCLSNVLT